ncbi:hypothetical protein SUGI_1134110 [Cryptomeria japonica]|nr:hypothetical protein SUGI_1134110 [Cryptomeria japonica]
MECSMCGDLGFQVYLFQCTKCLWRFEHQYCSRAYFDNVSDCKVCDWCYTIQEEEAASKISIMKDSTGLGESMGKVKRNLRNCYDDIDFQIPKEQKKQKRSEIVDRRVRKRYKLLDEILC